MLGGLEREMSEHILFLRYGGENNADGEALTKAASLYGGALRNVEKEYEDFNRTLCSQVTLSTSL